MFCIQFIFHGNTVPIATYDVVKGSEIMDDKVDKKYNTENSKIEQNTGDRANKGDDCMTTLTLNKFAKPSIFNSNLLSINKIEKELGLKSISPVHFSKSDIDDRANKNEDYSDWYEEELREFYNGK